MKKRDTLIVLLALGAAPYSLMAQQPGKVWRVGWLSTAPKPAVRDANFLAFLEGMRNAGYVEGKNILMVERYADDAYERLQGLAAELVKLEVDVIAAVSGPAVQAAQLVTRTLPIVMVATSDPVGRKIIASLAKPGGNVTGPASFAFTLVDKHVELLHVALPKVRRIAVLTNPDNADALRVVQLAQAAAAKLGLNITSVQAKSAADIDAVYMFIAKERAGALIIAPDLLFIGQARRINELALKNRLPTMFFVPGPVNVGGLMSYGANPIVQYGIAGGYVARILKGARPADLPAEQPTKLELVINMKTAKAIGLTVPQELLLRADRVIE